MDHELSVSAFLGPSNSFGPGLLKSSDSDVTLVGTVALAYHWHANSVFSILSTPEDLYNLEPKPHQIHLKIRMIPC